MKRAAAVAAAAAAAKCAKTHANVQREICVWVYGWDLCARATGRQAFPYSAYLRKAKADLRIPEKGMAADFLLHKM